MNDDETSTRAEAHTTYISDIMDQIESIFSDKTGTLTHNVMDFMTCIINGISYGSRMPEIGDASTLHRCNFFHQLIQNKKVFTTLIFLLIIPSSCSNFFLIAILNYLKLIPH
jgi:P-type E1-E2 ATPase